MIISYVLLSLRNKRDDFDAWLSNQDFSVTEIGKITPIHYNRSQVKIDGSALSNANGGYDISKNNPHFTDLLRSPKLLLAFGFGSGFSPKAPGTVGTLAAIPLWLLISQLSPPLYWLLICLALCLAFICVAQQLRNSTPTTMVELCG